jgi:hypothetical protein
LTPVTIDGGRFGLASTRHIRELKNIKKIKLLYHFRNPEIINSMLSFDTKNVSSVQARFRVVSQNAIKKNTKKVQIALKGDFSERGQNMPAAKIKKAKKQKPINRYMRLLNGKPAAFCPATNRIYYWWGTRPAPQLAKTRRRERGEEDGVGGVGKN